MDAAAINAWYEQETIVRAQAGDAEAGREALSLCAAGLQAGSLSKALSWYLAARLDDLLDGVPPGKALCIARDSGRPRRSGIDWRIRVAALDALLALDGVRPEARIGAMRAARLTLCPELKGELDRSDAQGIRRAYAPMRKNCDRATLERLAGDVGTNPGRFIPQTATK